MRQNRHAPVRHSLRERATDRLATAVASLCDSDNDRSLSNVVVILNAGPCSSSHPRLRVALNQQPPTCGYRLQSPKTMGWFAHRREIRSGNSFRARRIRIHERQGCRRIPFRSLYPYVQRDLPPSFKLGHKARVMALRTFAILWKSITQCETGKSLSLLF